jgi:hypothetical protein
VRSNAAALVWQQNIDLAAAWRHGWLGARLLMEAKIKRRLCGAGLIAQGVMALVEN